MRTSDVTKQMILRKAEDSDKTAIRTLLESVALPTESIGNGTTTFYLAEEKGNLLGIAGFEFYGDDALLRSVAVPPQIQNKGIGDGIVDSMIVLARERNIKRIVLLTETAEGFFRKKGFKTVDRSSIGNESMNRSSEFTTACPTSAVCMIMELIATQAVSKL
ncbi:MAG TPA: arsenic resistance N-acetyltransferase ArsN2 [Bacteroidota bacterium]